MANLREMMSIAGYEMKMQVRNWVFGVFMLISLVGIVACHSYWQGNGVNWKMVALPCSMPLMNAYLFSLIQSLFLIIIMADIPRRMAWEGAFECIYARPFNNVIFYWGTVVGNFLLFLLLNVVVILVSILVVNLTSLAPVGWKYYMFYLLTLNIPAWFFVAGMTLWLSSVTKSRVVAIVFPVIWWMSCIWWLPYWQHGTFDYLASGIPNLFSETIGHLNFSMYLLHRGAYVLVGTGLLVCGINKMRRLPNVVGMRKVYLSGGVLLVVCGIVCGGLLEYSYYRNNKVRVDYYASFERNWQEATCRVRSHSIELEQRGERLNMQSDMTIYNSGRESLTRIILFLNPGLQVIKLRSGKDDLVYQRDEQVILIDRRLEVGDSLQLHAEYSGRIDERFCDLHLTRAVYEDAFYQDRFFATGRQGAFVNEKLLVLSPACVWYPVAIPPVNPLMPVATGRDFTRFRLLVRHPLQKVVISQGQMAAMEDSVVFECRNTLSGISLYGANYDRHFVPVDDKFSLQLNSKSWGKQLANNFSEISPADFRSAWEKSPGLKPFDNYEATNWYEPESPYLYLLEVPVSFRLDSHPGKPEAGLVEPGIIFLRERGFNMNIASAMAVGKVENEEKFNQVVSALERGVFSSSRPSVNSHPLVGLVKEKEPLDGAWSGNDNSGYSLRKVQHVWVHSLKYPFMGKVLEKLYLMDFNQARGFLMGGKKDNDYLIGKSLIDILRDDNESVLPEKLDDLWLRLTLQIPSRELRQSLDSVYESRVGEVDYDSLIQIWTARWNVDVGHVMQDWMNTRHEQYFKVKDAILYYDPKTRRSKAVGKIMNAGKSGGIVSIEYGFFNQIQRSVCYFEPGEVKAFTLVTDMHISSINSILSANRPTIFSFQQGKVDHLDAPWELEEEWHVIPLSEFIKGENPNEFVVDDQDTGFELKEGYHSWLQKRRKTTPPVVPNTQMGGDDRCWKRVINIKACGDSIRGYHYASGGSGKSTATWRLNLPKAGRYQVMSKVYRDFCRPLVTGIQSGVVYYYTVSFGDRQEEVEVNLDAELSGSNENSCWASLGVFNFPAGEVSVTLSDKEIQGRKDIAIVADAVKWIKLE